MPVDQNKFNKDRPRAGDGTLSEKRQEPEANWYGASQYPQEEYIKEHREPSRASLGGEQNQTSDENSGSDKDQAQAPKDIFPVGGPEAQSDG